MIANTALQHDAVLDYYGRRLATCSSDRTVKIFEVEGETHRLTETLKGYASPSQSGLNTLPTTNFILPSYYTPFASPYF